ncbi:MAG TPA: MFS transporter, partial [Acidimicrobiales bacterium]|nr:MFS transporter [Acidimicrobiales bacterium]
PGRHAADAASGAPAAGDELAVANARLGLLASLTGLLASIPAVGIYELFGAPWVLRVDMVVFVVGTVTAARLPLDRPGRARRDALRALPPAAPAMGPGRAQWDEETPIGALGPRVNTHPEVVLALSAMSILKGLVGFVTFLLAFALKSSKHTAPWYGFMLVATMAGTILGVLLVPRARKVLSEPQLIAVSIWSVAVAGALAAVVGGIVVQALVALVIGMAGSGAKPAFDALVQRYVPVAAQGRAFARFETRLQLVWVLGALFPVVVHLPLGPGDTVIAATAAVAGLSYLTSRRALRHRWVAP